MLDKGKLMYQAPKDISLQGKRLAFRVKTGHLTRSTDAITQSSRHLSYFSNDASAHRFARFETRKIKTNLVETNDEDEPHVAQYETAGS